MVRSTARSASFQTFFGRPGASLPWFVRAVLALWAVLFMLTALVLGLFAGAGLLVWSLLRGRRPVVRVARTGMPHGPFASAHRDMAAEGDVVEGQAREISGPERQPRR